MNGSHSEALLVSLYQAPSVLEMIDNLNGVWDSVLSERFEGRFTKKRGVIVGMEALLEEDTIEGDMKEEFKDDASNEQKHLDTYKNLVCTLGTWQAKL